MLALSPHTVIFIAAAPVDFRVGIDGLALRCRPLLDQNPLSDAVFVFRNRQRTAVKLLSYDGQEFVLLYKRWPSGRLNWWPDNTSDSQQVQVRDLQILLYNGNPLRAKMDGDWRPLNPLLERLFGTSVCRTCLRAVSNTANCLPQKRKR